MYLASGGSSLTVSDTDSVNLTLAGSNLSADVEISATAGNQVSIAGDGLFVPKGAGVTVSDTSSVDLTVAAGNISGVVKISADAGNQTVLHADGVFTPASSAITVDDTDTVDLTLAANVLTADVIIDPAGGNQLTSSASGLYVAASGGTPDDGWIAAGETWTFDSATTITVPTDATTKYQPGDKIKLDDGGTKYANIIAVSATLLTITGTTLSGGAITNPYYSRAEEPFGFPTYFTWVTTVSASGAMTATADYVTYGYIGNYYLKGLVVHFTLLVAYTVGGVSDLYVYYTLPTPAVSDPDPVTIGSAARICTISGANPGFWENDTTTIYSYGTGAWAAGLHITNIQGWYILG
jgi:hypothetical protein